MQVRWYIHSVGSSLNAVVFQMNWMLECLIPQYRKWQVAVLSVRALVRNCRVEWISKIYTKLLAIVNDLKMKWAAFFLLLLLFPLFLRMCSDYYGFSIKLALHLWNGHATYNFDWVPESGEKRERARKTSSSNEKKNRNEERKKWKKIIIHWLQIEVELNQFYRWTRYRPAWLHEYMIVVCPCTHAR